jgi:hypothetical protein
MDLGFISHMGIASGDFTAMEFPAFSVDHHFHYREFVNGLFSIAILNKRVNERSVLV